MADLIFDGEYANIPEGTQSALLWYVTTGQPVGDFLHAVLCNDLQGAYAHADDENARALRSIVRWVFNRAPSSCWGSLNHVRAWQGRHGQKGEHAA